MFNLGAGEVMVIMLLALIVLGPQRLPDAAKQVGRFMGEIRRLSSGFQSELRTAFDDETEAAARRRGALVAPAETDAEPTATAKPSPDDAPRPGTRPAKSPSAPRRPRRTAPLRGPSRPSAD